jgi:hypothetical protein
MNKYVEMDTFVSNNCIDIKEISVFETMIKENGVNTIFYGKRTARSKYNSIEGECFLFIIDSVFYVFTYHSKYGIYKSIEDYNDGLKNYFENPLEYYFSKTININNYFEYLQYLMDEYSIDIVNIKNVDNKYNENKYYLEIIDSITEIENIKVKYKLNKKESIIGYNIINNVKKEEYYTIKELYEICKCNVGFGISVDFEKEFQKYVEKSNHWNSEKVGTWEFDDEKFKIYIEKMFKILQIEIKLKNEENTKNYIDDIFEDY